MFRAPAVVATLFTYTYAQYSLSWECQSTLMGLASDPAALTCLNIEQLLPIAAAIETNASVVPIINNWFNCLCCQPACSTETITIIHNLLVKKCPTEDWAVFDPTIYPTFRKADCLKNANGTLCFSEYLISIESYSGTLTYEKFRYIVQGVAATMYPANISCTDCNKARYNTFRAGSTAPSGAGADPGLQSLCGAAFVDGQMPRGITQSANNVTSTVKTTVKDFALSIFSPNLVMHSRGKKNTAHPLAAWTFFDRKSTGCKMSQMALKTTRGSKANRRGYSSRQSTPMPESFPKQLVHQGYSTSSSFGLTYTDAEHFGFSCLRFSIKPGPL